MFNLFKRLSKEEQLERKRLKLLQEAFVLSTRDRAAADRKMKEADDIQKQLEALEQES